MYVLSTYPYGRPFAANSSKELVEFLKREITKAQPTYELDGTHIDQEVRLEKVSMDSVPSNLTSQLKCRNLFHSEKFKLFYQSTFNSNHTKAT